MYQAALLAQLVERSHIKPKVWGLNPSWGCTFFPQDGYTWFEVFIHVYNLLNCPPPQNVSYWSNFAHHNYCQTCVNSKMWSKKLRHCVYDLTKSSTYSFQEMVPRLVKSITEFNKHRFLNIRRLRHWDISKINFLCHHCVSDRFSGQTQDRCNCWQIKVPLVFLVF